MPGHSVLGRVLLGTVLIWLVLDRSATALGSLRGEAGVLVGAITVAAAVLFEWLLFKTTLPRMPERLGLNVGQRGQQLAALLATGLICLLLLAYFPIFAWLRGTTISMRSDWLLLVPGLFAQHGIAEEMLFRGFAFGHLRQDRSFWQAAWLSLLPFTAAHLLLFFNMEPVLAAASILVAVTTALPLAWLYERGGQTIWAAALLHFGIHAIKLVDVEASHYMPLALGWMAVSATLPYLAFALLRPLQPTSGPVYYPQSRR